MTRRRREPIPPRWQTPLPPNVVDSWGPDVADYAWRELRIDLDLWQRRALNRALAIAQTPRAMSFPGRRTDRGARHLAHRIYLASAGRQSGKTATVRSLVGWAMTADRFPDWRLILGLAHDRAQARVPYEAVLEDLRPIKERWPRTPLALTRYLGIRSDMYGRHREYKTASRQARDSIRTYSVDLGVFDEIRTQRTYDTWNALEPTTRARPEPLIFGISTAGDDRSVVLRDWWQRGIRIIEGEDPAGFGMTWYAAPDGADPYSTAAILAANPSVAEGRVPLAGVAASRYALTNTGYLQETLNLWTEGGDELLPPGLWKATEADQPAGGIRITFGAETTSTWRRVSVAVAIATDAGVWVGMAGELDSARGSSSAVAPREFVRLIDRLAAKWKPSAIAFSQATAAAPHIAAWAERQKRVKAEPMNTRQVRAASQLWRSELIARRLTHSADPLLAQQAKSARPTGPVDGDWYISLRDSAGEVDGYRAAAWAAWSAIAPDAKPRVSQIAFRPRQEPGQDAGASGS